MKPAFFKVYDKGYLMFSSISKRDRFVECERKEKLTNLLAQQIIKKIFQREKKMMRTYLCPHCGSWHITHKL